MKKPIAILGLLIALPAAYGVKTQSISHTAYKEFIAGEFDNVSLSYDGRLNLSSAVEQVVEIEEPIIWAAVADSEGNLYLGTGNAGKVLKVDPEGEVTTVFSPEEILSRALAVDDAGNLYVGTSPIGRVYRIPRSGRPEIYFDPEDTYIWDLAIDDEGNLFVSTGASARIYKLPPDYQPNDEPVIWFECEQSHLTAMAWDNAGHLLVGSSPDGILYRVREEGKGFALFNSESVFIFQQQKNHGHRQAGKEHREGFNEW
jgi:ligand-binding sensor domain-containing protein